MREGLIQRPVVRVRGPESLEGLPRNTLRAAIAAACQRVGRPEGLGNRERRQLIIAGCGLDRRQRSRRVARQADVLAQALASVVDGPGRSGCEQK
jgi:hypothetical protein